jgi:peroxidase
LTINLDVSSGSHTIGKARCTSFQARLFNQRHPDELPTSGPPIEVTYLGELRRLCPQVNGDGNVTNPLDACTPTGFDNQYFKDLQASEGLLFSDAALQFTPGLSLQLVELYANDQQKFFDDFTHSMLKMGAIHMLTSDTGDGEVRRNCRIPNSHFSLPADPEIGV